ncbi:FHA domain-containing protein [Massilia sp. W12]|uniref:FHA domain-containing protein n=1 Tax=Massilia sp. W12 TaxID=3126507 RepID=UPI0030CEC353
MKRCQHPDHPHCTQWVLPGAAVCGAQHVQPQRERALEQAARSWQAQAWQGQRAQLRVSGFDPRAAGGRQSIRLHILGIPAAPQGHMQLVARSELLAGGIAHLRFDAGAHGQWQPQLLQFSSHGKLHGQYAIEVELQLQAQVVRRWRGALVILAPRRDASLAQIHQSYLSTHKNVRIHAEDGAIANLQGLLAMPGAMTLELEAKNGALAQLDMQGALAAEPSPTGLAQLSWDEDLFEIEAAPLASAPARAQACICLHTPGLVAHVRLFAQDEFVLGRWQAGPAQQQADLRLAPFAAGHPQLDGMARRISARHALIRARENGWEIEDVSRFGLLLDGQWPGRHQARTLSAGMRLECCHSFPGLLQLEVAALTPQLLVLQRCDAGRLYECFYLLKPETRPATESKMPAGLPLLFHEQQGFWRQDQHSGLRLRLLPGALAAQAEISDLAPASVLHAAAYP